jgi:DNA-binding response OmpR family regulator
MKVLFVENHAELAAVTVTAFLAVHEVEVVATLVGARAALARGNFDVALVDYDLDDGKGDVLVRWMRERGHSLPIVAVSARTEGNEALVAAGADRVCGKLEMSRIASVIDELARARGR